MTENVRYQLILETENITVILFQYPCFSIIETSIKTWKYPQKEMIFFCSRNIAWEVVSIVLARVIFTY